MKATKLRNDSAWERFKKYIVPWFEKNFEDSVGSLLRETRGFYRGDELFRNAVRAGDNRRAKRELKELLGCIN